MQRRRFALERQLTGKCDNLKIAEGDGAVGAQLRRKLVGARELAYFTAVNNTDHTITGSAVFNVSPDNVGQYFVKIQCFCFTEQTLRPHERVRMPVIFYVDPGFATDPDTKIYGEITLSYTFFPVAPSKTAS